MRIIALRILHAVIFQHCLVLYCIAKKFCMSFYYGVSEIAYNTHWNLFGILSGIQSMSGIAGGTGYDQKRL